MTSYLDTKTAVKEGKLDLPGPLSFSERIACNALSDRYGRVSTTFDRKSFG
jgi:hypothetical protein